MPGCYFSAPCRQGVKDIHKVLFGILKEVFSLLQLYAGLIQFGLRLDLFFAFFPNFLLETS